MALLPLTSPTSVQIYSQLQNLATSLKSNSVQVTQAAASGNVNCQMVMRMLASTQALLLYAQQVAADSAVTASLVAYLGTTGVNTTTTVADFANSIAVLQALVTAIIADYPVDANGNMLDHKITSSTGTITWSSLTPSQLSGTLTAIQNWLATIS